MNQRIRTPATPSSTETSKPLSGNQAAKEAADNAQRILDAGSEFGPGGINRRKILEVADAIEAAGKTKKTISGIDIGFNMNWYITDTSRSYNDKMKHGCGTVACIAGWVAHMEGGPVSNAKERATRILGIDVFTADDLFMGRGVGNLARISPAHAVAVIRNLAKTGRVEWASYDNKGNRK